MCKKILLIGGGGHCKSVLDTILELDDYCEIGIIDTEEHVGETLLGVPIIGTDDDLKDLFKKGYTEAFITVGSIGKPILRINLYNYLKKVGFNIPIIIDPSAIVSRFSVIAEGVFIGKKSIINAGSEINCCAIINSGSVVEHDCKIGSFAHLASGTVLGGEVVIGENTHIGSNSTIRNHVEIGNDSIVGMGSVVLRDVPNETVAYGNPCKEVRPI